MFTAIPAGHCPGSAMLLIEGDEGVALYTGEFRFEKGTAPNIVALHDSCGRKKDIDAVYLDGTFLTPRAMSIPSRYVESGDSKQTCQSNLRVVDH